MALMSKINGLLATVRRGQYRSSRRARAGAHLTAAHALPGPCGQEPTALPAESPSGPGDTTPGRICAERVEFARPWFLDPPSR